MVRDLIIEEYYCSPFIMGERCRYLPGKICQNYFGNVKWEIDNYEFDIMAYSSQNNAQSLEPFFEGCIFNLGSIAYCSNKEEVYSLHALDGIRNKEISLINKIHGRPQATLVRAINLERKTRYILNQKIKKYINPSLTVK